MEDFVMLLKALMIEENGYTEDEATRLIKKYPMIVAHGILKGPFALRPTVMAIEIEEKEKEEGE